MRMPNEGPPRLAVALLLFLLAAGFFHPRPAPAQKKPDIADLMGVFEKAYIKLMESVILVPVQQLAGDTPYDEIEKSAVQISEAAKLLPNAGDKDFAAFARQVQRLGDRLGSVAKEKRLEAAADAFVRLRLACLKCHADFRF